MQKSTLESDTYNIVKTCLQNTPHPFGENVFKNIKSTISPTGDLTALLDEYVPGIKPPNTIEYDEQKLREVPSLFASIDKPLALIFQNMGEEKIAKLGLSGIFMIWARLEEETKMLYFSQRLHRLNHHLLSCEQVIDTLDSPDKSILEERVFPADYTLKVLRAFFFEATSRSTEHSRSSQKTHDEILTQILNSTSMEYREYHDFEAIMFRLQGAGARFTGLLGVPEKLAKAQNELNELTNRMQHEYPRTAGASGAQTNEFIETRLLPLQQMLAGEVSHISKITAWESGSEPQAKTLIVESQKIAQSLKKMDVYYPPSRKTLFAFRA